jgi:hypothetical protein
MADEDRNIDEFNDEENEQGIIVNQCPMKKTKTIVQLLADVMLMQTKSRKNFNAPNGNQSFVNNNTAIMQ